MHTFENSGNETAVKLPVAALTDGDGGAATFSLVNFLCVNEG